MGAGMQSTIKAGFSFGCMFCLLAACSQPIGPIAGGALDGEKAPWPDDWAFSFEVENVLLETNPNDPYSVTLWGVHVGRYMYAIAVDSDSRWAKNMAADSRVVLGLSGKLYNARAEVVSSEATTELAEILRAYVAKYDIDPEEGSEFVESGAILYRLAPP